MTRVLIIPGLNGSGAEHWQTRWERLDTNCRRVEQRSWGAPDLGGWCSALGTAVEAETAPVVLVAHSLGCALVAHWARQHATSRVVGALLVAPADVEDVSRTPESVRGFAPLPSAPLPFPSVLVASRDDPYMSLERATHFAGVWGSRLVDAGACGHINAESDLGGWPLGRHLLGELLRATPFVLDARLAADTVCLAESELSLLLLMNERRYPWLILVPRRSAVTELYELDPGDRATLFEESCLVARTLGEEFQADKLNVGALGNVVRQLHVHHVVRSFGDPAWPGPVWGHSPREPRTAADLEALRRRLAATALASRFRFF